MNLSSVLVSELIQSLEICPMHRAAIDEIIYGYVKISDRLDKEGFVADVRAKFPSLVWFDPDSLSYERVMIDVFIYLRTNGCINV